MTRCALFVGVCVGMWATDTVARGQEPEKPARGMGLLKALAGTWDVTAKAAGAEVKATAVIKVELGGLWVTSEIKAEFLGRTFEQRGLGTYDADKKRYTFAWADSESTSLHTFEGTYDEKAEKMTALGELPGPDGKPIKFKMEVVPKSNNRFVQTLVVVGNDGKDQELASLTYARRK